jgi:anti-anti-sigma regulatory factor
MTIKKRTVLIKQLPETLSGKHGRVFFRELESCMHSDRPYIVLDCSKIQRLDRSAVDLMFCCLEEAIKHNGDVKLAELPAGSDSILELTGVNRLFDIFDTAAAAVHSFQEPMAEVAAEARMPEVVAARTGKTGTAGLRWSFLHAQSIGGFEEN